MIRVIGFGILTNVGREARTDTSLRCGNPSHQSKDSAASASLSPILHQLEMKESETLGRGSDPGAQTLGRRGVTSSILPVSRRNGAFSGRSSLEALGLCI